MFKETIDPSRIKARYNGTRLGEGLFVVCDACIYCHECLLCDCEGYELARCGEVGEFLFSCFLHNYSHQQRINSFKVLDQEIPIMLEA
jgi:hypothetical protein